MFNHYQEIAPLWAYYKVFQQMNLFFDNMTSLKKHGQVRSGQYIYKLSMTSERPLMTSAKTKIRFETRDKLGGFILSWCAQIWT
jgi:hypothetical protein